MQQPPSEGQLYTTERLCPQWRSSFFHCSSRLYHACKRGEGGIDVDIRKARKRFLNFAPRLDEYVAGLRIANKARFAKGVYMTCSRSDSWSGDGLHRSGVVSPRRGCAVEGANRVARPRRVVSSFHCKQFLPTLDLCQIRAQARMAA
jgi:hypothetical protein